MVLFWQPTNEINKLFCVFQSSKKKVTIFWKKGFLSEISSQMIAFLVYALLLILMNTLNKKQKNWKISQFLIFWWFSKFHKLQGSKLGPFLKGKNKGEIYLQNEKIFKSELQMCFNYRIWNVFTKEKIKTIFLRNRAGGTFN